MLHEAPFIIFCEFFLVFLECGKIINFRRVPLKARDCAAARDAFAKAIYSRVFDCVVARINASIPFDESAAAGNFIGVLDIAGFGKRRMEEIDIGCGGESRKF